MGINVRNDSRIVDIWLTRDEKWDERVQRGLKRVYQSFKGTGYTVATFLSGDQNLTDTTSGLICKRLRKVPLQSEQRALNIFSQN